DAIQRNRPVLCDPGTHLRLREDLVTWLNNRKGGPVRWISGWAGTGKTTIAQTMAKYWGEQGRLAASFFFSR
ncbi:hypothetical protein BDN72DRAFT_725573, partial [Pluteus cervinus]